MTNPHVPGDLRVRWAIGRPSDRYRHIETSETEGQWRPADGYTWVADPPVLGSTGVKWTPGQASNEYLHVEADEPEGQWRPADGYIWAVDPHAPGDMRVKWAPGHPSGRYSHVVTLELEGRWYPADGYVWVNNPPSPGDFRVKWMPGRASNEYPNIFSSDTEGEWHPGVGFTWLNPSVPKDHRVKPVETPAPSPSLGLDSQRSEPSAAFQDGLADRRTWERWFASLTGDYREGAYYWSSERSSPKPGPCYGQGYSRDFVEGCANAKEVLAPTDVRRNSQPDYKAGWNSYLEPPTSPSRSQAAPTEAPGMQASPIRWYPDMDAPGNDLGGRDGWSLLTNADDCMRKCLSDRNCVGVTYNQSRSVCIPKSRIAPLIRSEDAAITGVITDRTAPPTVSNVTARVQQYPNMDAPGNDRDEWICRVSRKDCESICVVDPGCAGYTYNTQKLTCIKKSFIGGLALSSEPVVTGIVEGRNVSGR